MQKIPNQHQAKAGMHTLGITLYSNMPWYQQIEIYKLHIFLLPLSLLLAIPVKLILPESKYITYLTITCVFFLVTSFVLIKPAEILLGLKSKQGLYELYKNNYNFIIVKDNKIYGANNIDDQANVEMQPIEFKIETPIALKNNFIYYIPVLWGVDVKLCSTKD